MIDDKDLVLDKKVSEYGERYEMSFGQPLSCDMRDGYREGYADAMDDFFNPKCIKEVINSYFNWIDQQLDDEVEKSSILKEFMEKRSKIISENEDNSETNKLITDLFDEYLVKFIKENLYGRQN